MVGTLNVDLPLSKFYVYNTSSYRRYSVGGISGTTYLVKLTLRPL